MVVVPGTEGDFGVMAGHAPYMSTLRDGELAIYRSLARRRARADRRPGRLRRGQREGPDRARGEGRGLVRRHPAGTSRGFCERHSSSPPAMIRAAPPKVARSGRVAEQQPAQRRRDEQLDIGHRRHHRRRARAPSPIDEQYGRASRSSATPRHLSDDAAPAAGTWNCGSAGQVEQDRPRRPAAAPRPAASRNCITIAGAAPAALRLRSSARPCRRPRRAGRKRARPSASRLGRSTTSTPAKASRVAPQTARRRPLAEHQRREQEPVRIGLVNWIAVASASGIAITAMKKQIVASATAAPRPSCSPGRGMTKPARPSRQRDVERRARRRRSRSAAPTPPSPARRRPSTSPARRRPTASRSRQRARSRAAAGVVLCGHCALSLSARLGNCQSFRPIHHPEREASSGGEDRRRNECFWTTQRRKWRRGRRTAQLRHRAADEGPGGARPSAGRGRRASSRRSSPIDFSAPRTTASPRRADRGDAMARLADRQAPVGRAEQSRTKASRPRSTGSRSRSFPACSSASTRKRRRPSPRTSSPRSSGRSSARCSPS